MSTTKMILVQAIGGLAIAILVLFAVAFGADKISLPADAKLDLAIERAARRTDQKLNARWMALLDSIIVEIHGQFLLERKAEIDLLKRREKKRLLKAISAESRVRADSLLGL